MQKNMELKEPVEELEHQGVLLSRETDTIRDYAALYHIERAVLEKQYKRMRSTSASWPKTRKT
jgi:hypothetical protein